jgi:RimJ/RimL family protein N-acetyltransferase
MDDATFSVSIPRLTTTRLLLREYRTADFELFAENMTDPVATQFLTSHPDRRSAWRGFTAAAGQWVVQGAGWWAAELRETGEVVGWIGAFFRENSPHLEVGWTLRPKFWRQGLATEAAKAALDYGVEKYGARKVIAHIANGNTASVRVSEKLGMSYEGDVPFFDDTVGLYAVAVEARVQNRAPITNAMPGETAK